MITSFSTVYERKDCIEFLIDDEKSMTWISSFDSSSFNRLFIIIDKEVEKKWGKQIKKQITKQKKESLYFAVEGSEKTKSRTIQGNL